MNIRKKISVDIIKYNYLYIFIEIEELIPCTSQMNTIDFIPVLIPYSLTKSDFTWDLSYIKPLSF
jgi:hypothetical protein